MCKGRPTRSTRMYVRTPRPPRAPRGPPPAAWPAPRLAPCLLARSLACLLARLLAWTRRRRPCEACGCVSLLMLNDTPMSLKKKGFRTDAPHEISHRIDRFCIQYPCPRLTRAVGRVGKAKIKGEAESAGIRTFIHQHQQHMARGVRRSRIRRLKPSVMPA